MSDLLNDAAIDAELAKIPGWHREGKELVKEFDCRDFSGAIKFVNAVAHIANAVNHHPELTISWNKVTVRTSSHDSGGITPRDVDLAERIQSVAMPA